MTTIKKMSLALCLSTIVIFVVGANTVGYCDDVTLWASIDDSNQYCNILIDAMAGDALYDPFYQYAVVRAGERDYRIYFGKDLSKGNLTRITYIPQYQGFSASLSRDTNKTLSINKNGYYYVSNSGDGLRSDQAERYKMGFVVTIAIIILVLLILFRIFRRTEKPKQRFYNVRG